MSNILVEVNVPLEGLVTIAISNSLSGVSSSVPIRVIDALPSSDNVTDISSATGGSFTSLIVIATVAISDDSSPSLAL